MKALFKLITTLALVLGATSALASKEGMLTLDAFNLTSPGIGASGPVVISGKQDRTGVKELTINAFEKQYHLDKAQIAQMQGLHFNGLQLSYEGSFKELGGRTIYLVRSKGFVVSGTVDRRFVVIKENGTVETTSSLKGEKLAN